LQVFSYSVHQRRKRKVFYNDCLQDKYTAEEVEESIPNYPIFQVRALDPDIGNPSVEQNITYYLDSKSQVNILSLFSRLDDEACISFTA
jgi:hypothetical protein